MIARCSICNRIYSSKTEKNKCEESHSSKAAVNGPVNFALKFDSGKPDLSIIPIEALEEMARAFEYGAKKYERNNFKKGLHTLRTLASSLRHIYAFINKEDNDTESGLSHLSHAMAALAMTIYNLKHNPQMDDR